MTRYILSLSLLITALTLKSQTINWTGTIDDDWFNAGNWSPANVPTSSDEVVVDFSTAMNNINIDTTGDHDTAYAKTINVSGNGKFGMLPGSILDINTNLGTTPASLTVDDMASFSSHGQVFIQGSISDGIRLDGNATMQIQEDGALHILDFANNTNGVGLEIETGTLFSNRGLLTIRGGGNNIEDGIVNDGIFQNESNASLMIKKILGNNQSFGIESYHLIENTGCINIDSVENAAAIRITGSGSEFKNDGSVFTTNILDTDKAGVEILNGALVYGNGIFNTHLLSIGGNGSTINPGGKISAGQLLLFGDFYMDMNAKFEFDIRGDNGPGSNLGHDIFPVNGTVTLQNNVSTKPILKVNLRGGFVPEDHKNYKFISHAAFEGTFSTTVEKPVELAGWSFYFIGNYVVFGNSCGGEMIIENCGDACTLWSGFYRANESILYSGDFTIPASEIVEFSSPETELMNGFSVEQGALFEIKTDGCSL